MYLLFRTDNDSGKEVNVSYHLWIRNKRLDLDLIVEESIKHKARMPNDFYKKA